MKRLIACALLIALGGCSSFKLGTVLYCPYGQNCDLAVKK